jgi:hypothetical protein
MRLLETDSNSNKDISAAVSIASYTATALCGVIARVLINQVAGGGDYIIYATLTKSAVEYRVIPLTTATAAAALTSIGFVSVVIPLDTDDILQVYVDGLAADTTTPDTRTDFYVYNYLQPTVAGRTLDVAATGEAGLDFTNRLDTTGILPGIVAGGAGGLAIVGSNVGSAASVTGDVGGKVLGGGISTITGTGVQAALADDAITASKFDESTAYPLKAADAGATQVARVGADADTLETLSDQVDALSLGGLSAQNVRDAMKLAPTAGSPATGSIDKHLDDIAGRCDDLLEDTGTTLPAQIAALNATIALTQTTPASSGSLALTTHHTWRQTITSTSTAALGAATKLWLAVKRHRTDDDEDAVFFVEQTAGLTVLDGAAYTTVAHGSLTVTGESGDWDIACYLNANALALLEEYVGEELAAALKAQVAGDDTLVWSGTATIEQGIVQAV